MANSSAALLPRNTLWQPASTLHLVREEPAFLPLLVPALNSLLINGLQRGAIAEIYGPKSSGRTSTSMHVLAQATAAGEICAFIDTNDTFHPDSAARAGICLNRLIWVRSHGNAEHALRAADLLLHAGGFGVVLLDLCDTTPRVLNRIPLSYWYRFRRALENTPSILLICAANPQANSCSLIKLALTSKAVLWSGRRPFSLLRGVESKASFRHTSLLRTASLAIHSSV